MMDQLSIFDFIPEIKNEIPCRWLKEGDEFLIGNVIPFQQLREMIGKKVIVTSGQHYKVVRITEYYEQTQTIYKRVRPLPPNNIGYGDYVNSYIHDVVGIKECMSCYDKWKAFDVVAYTDTDRSNKANSSVSEYYCTGGRWIMNDSNNTTFYELKA